MLCYCVEYRAALTDQGGNSITDLRDTTIDIYCTQGSFGWEDSTHCPGRIRTRLSYHLIFSNADTSLVIITPQR